MRCLCAVHAHFVLTSGSSDKEETAQLEGEEALGSLSDAFWLFPLQGMTITAGS